jgi:hypothetical protein
METASVFPFSYLIISGGAERGIGFCGALDYLRKKLNKPLNEVFSKGIAGTSIGALIALLICAGYEPIEIVASWLVEKASWSSSIFCGKIDHGPVVGKSHVVRFLNENQMIKWLNKLLTEKGVESPETLTFEDFRKHFTKSPNLVICATSLAKKKAVYYNYDRTPKNLVLRAVQASMAAVPLVSPVLDEVTNELMVDGGFSDNFAFGTAFGADSVNESFGICCPPDYSQYGTSCGKIEYLQDIFCLAFYCQQVFKLETILTYVFQDDEARMKKQIVELDILPKTIFRVDEPIDTKMAGLWFSSGSSGIKEWLEISNLVSRFEKNQNDDHEKKD